MINVHGRLSSSRIELCGNDSVAVDENGLQVTYDGARTRRRGFFQNDFDAFVTRTVNRSRRTVVRICVCVCRDRADIIRRHVLHVCSDTSTSIAPVYCGSGNTFLAG